MNWSSATVLANIDKSILVHGFDCDAELVPGDTMPTGTSMIEKSEPDIAPELWTNSIKEALDKGVAEKRLRYAGESLSDGGEQGFFVPEYMVAKNPSLATIEGIKANAALFIHPEDPDASAIYGCPAGWNCQISVEHLFEALDLDDFGFDLIDPGSGAGLSGSIAKAYERQEAWFGYYWSPTSILGKYKMVMVDFGTGVDVDEFEGCITQEICEDPNVTMYPSALVHSITTESFAVESPEAFGYIANRSLKNEQMNELLAWMEENQADGDYAAEYFLKNNEDTWNTWVSDSVFTKVKLALSNM